MRRLGLVVLLVCLVATPAAGGGNEPPLADAGLDQQVQRGETVLLDAAGSRDPDGSVEETSWRVEAPDGTTFTPRCGGCSRTRFPASQLGTHVVTLTVTDDDGASRTDSLRVRVVPGASLLVTVAGPATVDRGTNGTYRAWMAVRNGSLARVVWTIGGRTAAERTISGDRATDTLSLHHGLAGEQTVRAIVTTAAGRRANDTHAVRVQAQPSGRSVDGGFAGWGSVRSTSTRGDSRGPGATPVTVPGTGAPAGSDASPTVGPVPDERVPDVELNDARRRLWLAPRDEPETDDDRGAHMPAGFGDGGGASAAVYVGGDPDDESTEFVPVAAHTAREARGDAEPTGSEVHVRGLGGTRNVTASG